MFTGLVGELGIIESSRRQGNSFRLTVQAKATLEDLRIGDSVAVNGACLTVVEKTQSSFSADVMPETSKHTVVPAFKNGDRVNLERTLRVGDRLDGHIVSGHVEYIGEIIDYKEDDIAVIVTVKMPIDAMKYIIMKGSVAIDGISLTISAVGQDWFSVSIIPHTAKCTTLGSKNKGSLVNIETDILGKYVEKLLGLSAKSDSKNDKQLSMATLLENGFV